MPRDRDPTPLPTPVPQDALGLEADPPAEGATDSVGLGEHLARSGVPLEAAAAGAGHAQDIEEARVELDDARSALVALGILVPSQGRAAPSGIVDEAMAEAITQFQDDCDLEATGQLDPDTYEALMAAYEQALETARGSADAAEGDDFDPLPGAAEF